MTHRSNLWDAIQLPVGYDRQKEGARALGEIG
jgi:hypothetical protein